MTLAFDSNAEREMAAAVEFHERERPGHGALLLDELERVVARAERFPRSGAVVRGLEQREVRSFGLHHFPYVVIVARAAGVLTVIAFAHMKREPGYWQHRID